MGNTIAENQQQFGSLLTVLGENAEQNGKLLNKQIKFTYIAIGDANDTYVQPDRKQESLVNELARVKVNSVDVLQPTSDSVPMLKIEAILPDDLNDLVIREFAAVAEFNGQEYLHAIGNCARVYVPAPINNGNVSTPVTIEMIFVITSAEPIVLIDPNVVTASREYVKNKIFDSTAVIFNSLGNVRQRISSYGENVTLKSGNIITISSQDNKAVNYDVVSQLESTCIDIGDGLFIKPHKYEVKKNAQSISAGSSTEEKRSLSLGCNYISTMRPSDPAGMYGSGGFDGGSFIGDGSDNYCVWDLPGAANYFVCQARVYFDGSQNNALIGYNTAGKGVVDSSNFYGCGFSSDGFIFNDRKSHQILIESGELKNGFYEISLFYLNSFFIISIMEEFTTKAKSYYIEKTLNQPTNAMIGSYSQSDQIRDFRFASTHQASSPMVAPVGLGRSMATPIKIPNFNPSGVDIVVHLPAGYDPRITHKLAVYCHGAGGKGEDLWDYDNENSVLNSLLAAGFVVMAASYDAQGWGNQQSVNENLAAINYIKERYNVYSNPYFIVQSMGGLVGLNTIILGDIIPAAVAGIYPVTNLKYQYENIHTDMIQQAYGFNQPSDFESATDGYDVVNDNNPTVFEGVNFKFWHSYADTIVPREQNTDKFANFVRDGNGIIEVITSEGEHGDSSSFNGEDIVKFFSTL